MTENNVQRLRFIYTKGRPIKYISHLDLARALERACRRAKVDMVYSQGFSPRPRMAFASALPVGVTGGAEVADIWLSPSMEPEAFRDRMNPQLPPGLSISAAAEADPAEASLQSRIRWADYSVMLYDVPADLDARITELMAQEHIRMERMRKNKVQAYDLRPLIGELERAGESALWMRLANDSRRGTGRVDQVLEGLGLQSEMAQMERTRLIFEGEQSLEES